MPKCRIVLAGLLLLIPSVARADLDLTAPPRVSPDEQRELYRSGRNRHLGGVLMGALGSVVIVGVLGHAAYAGRYSAYPDALWLVGGAGAAAAGVALYQSGSARLELATTSGYQPDSYDLHYICGRDAAVRGAAIAGVFGGGAIASFHTASNAYPTVTLLFDGLGLIAAAAAVAGFRVSMHGLDRMRLGFPTVQPVVQRDRAGAQLNWRF
jgi:hypothetical protein